MFLWKSNVTNRLIAAESESDAIDVLIEEYGLGRGVCYLRREVITRQCGPFLIQNGDEIERYVDEEEAIKNCPQQSPVDSAITPEGWS